jgi:hypothetical protein
MQALSGNFLTRLMEMSRALRLPHTMHLSEVLLKRPTSAIVFEIAAKSTRLDHFLQGAESITPAT